MTIRGTARGRMIELDEALPFADGAPLTVNVEPARNGEEPPPGSPARVVEAIRRLPPVSAEDAAELMRMIDSDKRPASDRGVFDEWPDSE